MTRRDVGNARASSSWDGEEGENSAHLRTVAAAVVETVQAPPAVVFLHALQCQIPTAVRLTESLPQKVHLERGGRGISTFLLD